MISQNEWPLQGEYIDFRDKDNNLWQVGYVVLKVKNMIKVRSEGWSSKLDEVSQVANNSRIKPFRTIVRGYTGQVKNPALRQHWKFTPQIQQQNTQRFINFINDLPNKSEHEIRQYLRGHHYFWIDFLLTINYASGEELTLGYEYLKQHIKFTKMYLEKICQTGISEWCAQDAKLSQNERAYRQSYYQIMDALYILTGINVRQLTFQKNNEKVIKQAINQNLTHEKYVTRYISEIRLDQTYIKLLCLLEKQTFVDGKIIPIPFIYQFFHIFATIQKALLQKTDPPFDNMLNNKQQRKKITLRIFNTIKRQVQYITPAQLKSFQVEKQIESLLTQIKTTYYKYGLEQLAFEWIQKVRLKTAFLLVQSDTLQRKLKGIVKLKQIYQSLITVNDLNPYRLKPQDFIAFLSENKIVQQLFQNNDHPQILKKGGQLCQLFLKSNFIHIDSIISIWKVCSHKHEAVRKVIYQLWIDILVFVSKSDLNKFTQPILDSCSNMNEGNVVLFVEEWELQMLLTFFVDLVKHYAQQLQGRNELDALFAKFIDLLYQKLIYFENSNQIKTFISSFAKLVNITTLCNKIIKQSYQSIAKNEHTNLHLQLLTTVYQQSFQKTTYLPANAIQIVFLALNSPENHCLSPIIFQLIDQIINFSNNIVQHFILTQQEFENLWKISQQNESIKPQFYSWLVKKNNDGLFGVPVYQISHSIPHELKSMIFKKFLCDYSKFDYFNLTLEELQIFKEFLIFQNDQENRIEIKRLMSVMKIIRVKNAQTLGNKFMWDIFLNCKNEQVIKQLSKIILAFHFNYHQAVDFKTRKAKIVTLLMKLDKHIKEGFKKGNIKLMKHSLILLKDIIDFVKQKHQHQQIMQNYQQYFKSTIKIFFQNKKYDLEICFGNTYYQIKTKIAEMIKLDRTKFQMFSLKNEEISLQFAEVPICFMQEKSIKIIRVLDNQQTIPHIVLNFIKDRVENTLIDMLEDQTICENVYKVLEQIQIKVEEGEFLMDKLTNIIQKHQKQSKGDFSKYEIYINLFYLRILNFMIQKPNFLLRFIKNKQINSLIEKLQININSSLTIVYLFNCVDIIHQILKKLKTIQHNQEIMQVMNNLKDNLKQKCMKVIDQLCHYINKTSVDADKTYNNKKVRIVFNCLNIIQQLEKGENAVIYIVNHKIFCQIVRKIYVNDCFNQIRLIYLQKLKKLLQKSRQCLKNSDDAAKLNTYISLIYKIANLFIKELYYQIKQKDGIYSGEKKVLYFYKFIGFIINALSMEHFVQIVIGNQGQISFYHDLLKNVRFLSDLPDATASPNYLLSAHLNILTSIYQKNPTLLSKDMLNYLLYNCLFYNKSESHQLDVACKKQQNIKAALDVVQAGVADYQNSQKIMKVIREVQEFHRIDYWRTSDNWSTSIENEVKAKYVGLQNPGCICYLNSLLQQLFMTKAFRDAIASLNLRQEEGENKLEMLKALKYLFFNLLHSEQIALNPTFFTKTVKSHDNKPLIKIFVQMDIDEFCSILFDKIQHQLNFIPNQPNIVKNIFGGVYAHQIISKECKHCSEREEQFISIGLQVKKNIVESFNTLIKGEMLDGENKYYCQKCDKKVKAQKVLTIKKLPQNLILSIKRFQYNYEIDAKIKINDYCEFPMQLNLKKYSQQEINKMNTSQNIEFTEENTESMDEELPDSYFMYKLKGVVVHTGSADSGHYYSFIEDAQKNWFQFNDSSVSPFDIKNLPEEAFGSKDAYQDKVKNAYLLFYQRIQSEKPSEPLIADVSEQNTSIIDEIVNKNKTISKFRLLFSKDYSDFVEYLLEYISKFDLTLEQQDNWYSFITSYYLLIKIRQGSVQQVIQMSKKISLLIEANTNFSKYFFNSIVDFNFLQEVFVYGSNRDKVKIIGKFLTKSFINYYLGLPQNFNSLKDTLIEYLLNHIKSLTLIHGNIYELQIFIREILDFTKSKNDYRLFKFLEHSFDHHLLTNVLGLVIPKEQKQLANKYKDDHKSDRNSTLSVAKNEGKKYLPASTKQSWQILQYFIQYYQTRIVEEQAEELDPLTHINNLLDKAAKGGIMSRVIHQCGVSKSVYRLYKVFKLTNKIGHLIQGIQKGLKDYQSTKYRQLLILLYFIMIDKDCSESTVKICIEMLQRVHAINEKYFLEVNFVHQWMIKYIQGSPLFLKLLSENQNFLSLIIGWINLKPLPSAQLIKKHKNPANERLLNRIHGLLVSADPKDYQKKSNLLKKKFQSVLNKKFELIHANIEWEKQYIDEFYPGGQIYNYDLFNRKWSKVKIAENNFGYLKLVQQNSSEISLWDDNQKLFSYKALSKEDVESSQSSEEEIVEQKIEPIEQEDLYN